MAGLQVRRAGQTCADKSKTQWVGRALLLRGVDSEIYQWWRWRCCGKSDWPEAEEQAAKRMLSRSLGDGSLYGIVSEAKVRSKQADRVSKEGARLYLSFKHQRDPGNAFSMGPCQGCEDAGWGLRRARRGNGIGFMQHFARRKRYLYWNKGETHEPCCCVQSSFLREEFEEWFARTGRYSSRRGGPDVQGWARVRFPAGQDRDGSERR